VRAPRIKLFCCQRILQALGSTAVGGCELADTRVSTLIDLLPSSEYFLFIAQSGTEVLLADFR
jgi:hypothetical protein